jgi:aminocarboxymuconate-semialdehyde decarboxylase
MDKKENNQRTTRRDFIKTVAIGGAVLGLQNAAFGAPSGTDSGDKQTSQSRPDVVIDFHAHLFPAGGSKAVNIPTPLLYDVNLLYAHQVDAGVDMTVISNAMLSAQAVNFDVLKEWNDFAAEVSAKSKGRIAALVCTNPFGGPPYVKEVERALREGGFKGIAVNSSVKGEYLDSQKAFPLYELACELDVPVFVHPPGETPGADKMREYRLVELVGRPFDTTLSLSRMIMFGVLERYPKLKIVAAHMGGGLAMLAGRLDYGYTVRKDPTFGPYGPDVLSKTPGEYISQIYVDSMGFHPPAVLCAVSTFGADHVLLGSDHPPVPIPLKRSVDVVKNLPITEQDKKKILGGNAARLMKLQKPA